MSRAALTSGFRASAAFVGFAAFLAPGLAAAQETSAPTERVGQQAEIQQPDYAEPTEFPAVTQAEPPSVPPVSGTTRFARVEVLTTGDAFGHARADFSAISNPAYGLQVTATPGTALNADWVAGQFAANGMVGETVPLERLVALVQLINRALVANGYINSGVLIARRPDTDQGALQLELISGGLTGQDNGVELEWSDRGAGGLSSDFVVDRMPSTAQRPLDVIALERDFRLLAEDPAIGSISADLQPGSVAGEARLKLVVRPAERADLYAGVANSRSPAIGGERFSVGGSLRNLISAGDIMSIEAGLTSGEPDARFAYATPVFDRDLSLNLLGGFNRAAVVDPELRPLDIAARDWNVEGGMTYRLYARPLTPERDGSGWVSARSFSVGMRVGHRVSETELLGRPFSLSPGAVDGRAEYTVARVTADFVQRGISTVLAVSLTGTQGLDGSKGDIPGLVTPDRNFRTANVRASYARLLTPEGLELRLRFAGQAADGILYSGERLAAGGRQTVRGYRETLALADQGMIGSIELAQPFDLTGRGGASQGFDWGRFSIAGFVDGAWLDNREVEDPVADMLWSVGAALTWQPSPGLSATFAYAHALKDAVPPGSRDLQDRGFHFAVTLRPLQLFR
ncbi:ShlB/FhaC/HecB family hemolysin secretion/activation protein [uncultured Erythrobacter sp.]|uniref:ShlB/FhaC/HecB family hemolysin secretion/activation protein n=1 Tax=uncultured Erythrobacter sp. TaxID=263913 RepID=UPI002613FB2E|nr:ShlB/FhaC/HecB family hemolysin secretion/activation protein [uncultured Erythrobacter sp.]